MCGIYSGYMRHAYIELLWWTVQAVSSNSYASSTGGCILIRDAYSNIRRDILRPSDCAAYCGGSDCLDVGLTQLICIHGVNSRHILEILFNPLTVRSSGTPIPLLILIPW